MENIERKIYNENLENYNDVEDYEIDLLYDRLEPKEFIYDVLVLNYGYSDSVDIINRFYKCLVPGNSEDFDEKLARIDEIEGVKKCLSLLNLSGVGTRWEEYLEFVCNLIEEEGGNMLEDITQKELLGLFSRKLGRVKSYRCLSMDEESTNRTLEKNVIWPSGRWRQWMRRTKDNIDNYNDLDEEGKKEIDKKDDEISGNFIEKNGVEVLTVARLYIGLRLVTYDPTLSLHDDKETTICIASGYLNRQKNHNLYLFHLSVPMIETLGWPVIRVTQRRERVIAKAKHEEESLYDDYTEEELIPKSFFKFSSIYFDARKIETERYVFYDIPFIKERLISLHVLKTDDEINSLLTPFQKSQYQKYQNFINGNE